VHFTIALHGHSLQVDYELDAACATGGCTTEEPFEVALRLLEVDQEVGGTRTQTGASRLSVANMVNFVDSFPARNLEHTRSIPFGALVEFTVE
jgi:hypothetical protein